MEQTLPSPSDSWHACSRRCQLALDLTVRGIGHNPPPPHSLGDCIVVGISFRVLFSVCCFRGKTNFQWNCDIYFVFADPDNDFRWAMQHSDKKNSSHPDQPGEDVKDSVLLHSYWQEWNMGYSAGFKSFVLFLLHGSTGPLSGRSYEILVIYLWTVAYLYRDDGDYKVYSLPDLLRCTGDIFLALFGGFCDFIEFESFWWISVKLCMTGWVEQFGRRPVDVFEVGFPLKIFMMILLDSLWDCWI